MLNCFAPKNPKKTIPISIILKNDFPNWIKKQNSFMQNWLASINFKAESANFSILPGEKGEFTRAICLVSDFKNFWALGAMPLVLPEGVYTLELDDATYYSEFAIAWGLGAYQFSNYKKPNRKPAKLLLSKTSDQKYITNLVESIYLVRDLINTPTDDMGPTELAAALIKLSKPYKAKVKQIIGEDLLKNNYASIHTVGRASDDAPRLLDMRWGNKKTP